MAFNLEKYINDFTVSIIDFVGVIVIFILMPILLDYAHNLVNSLSSVNYWAGLILQILVGVFVSIGILMLFKDGLTRATRSIGFYD